MNTDRAKQTEIYYNISSILVQERISIQRFSLKGMILTLIATLHSLHFVQELFSTKDFSTEDGPKGYDLERAIELQARVGPAMWSPQARSLSSMMHWLLATNRDVNKAEKMVRNHLAWRNSMNMDVLRHKKPSKQLLQKFPYLIAGPARNGYPVLILPFGIWDIRQFLREGGQPADFYKHQSQMWERALFEVEKVEKEKKSGARYYCICDMGGLQYQQFATISSFRLIIGMSTNFEENYPGVAKFVFMINTDTVFDLLMDLVRPFIEKSIEKMVRLGKNRKEWEPVIRQYVDPSLIPYRYGGLSSKEIKEIAARIPKSDY